MKFSKSLRTLNTLIIFSLLILTPYACQQNQSSEKSKPSSVSLVDIPDNANWSTKMALSVMKRAPEAWMNDFQSSPSWSYTLGLILHSVYKVAVTNSDSSMIDYVRGYGDKMINDDGSIEDYDISDYNIDNIAPGPLMFSLLRETGDQKYETAINTLKKQLDWQPKTHAGGYWHKLRYPWQVWLDGLFMGEPFMAEYAQEYGDSLLFDHIADQFSIAEEKTKDDVTGLLYHGWDESRNQAWSNKESGCSPHFWSRAIGWYCMGIVDALDYFPENHPKVDELTAILDRTLSAVLIQRDPSTKTWWQVMDQGDREGNYLESTSSCMFTYAMIKGVNKGYLEAKYRDIASECYNGILDTFIKSEEDGEIHLTNCCSVGGLGGNPYRDGSFEYYISEEVRDNDPKGLGPFIMASLEFEKSGS